MFNSSKVFGGTVVSPVVEDYVGTFPTTMYQHGHYMTQSTYTAEQEAAFWTYIQADFKQHLEENELSSALGPEEFILSMKSGLTRPLLTWGAEGTLKCKGSLSSARQSLWTQYSKTFLSGMAKLLI
jgi:hypothetical protein